MMTLDQFCYNNNIPPRIQIEMRLHLIIHHGKFDGLLTSDYAAALVAVWHNAHQ